MRIAFVQLSPNKDGASHLLLKTLRSELSADADFIDVNDRAAAPDLSVYDRIVLPAPVYINALPASATAFLTEAEAANSRKDSPIVFFISNCGYFEGENNLLAFEMIGNWCERCGFRLARRIGVGSGPRLLASANPGRETGRKSAAARVVSLAGGLFAYDGMLSVRRDNGKCASAIRALARDIEEGNTGDDVLLRPFFPRSLLLTVVLTDVWVFIKKRDLIKGGRD